VIHPSLQRQYASLAECDDRLEAVRPANQSGRAGDKAFSGKSVEVRFRTLVRDDVDGAGGRPYHLREEVRPGAEAADMQEIAALEDVQLSRVSRVPGRDALDRGLAPAFYKVDAQGGVRVGHLVGFERQFGLAPDIALDEDPLEPELEEDLSAAVDEIEEAAALEDLFFPESPAGGEIGRRGKCPPLSEGRGRKENGPGAERCDPSRHCGTSPPVLRP
jgi:hypothetical protein